MKRAGASFALERNLTSRPIHQGDEAFLSRLYASTREEELAVTGWDTAQKEAFLSGQFRAQHQFYQEQFPRAVFDLILLEGQPIGRLYLDRRQDEFRLIDIALLPEHRGRGIGSFYLQRLLAEAAEAGLPVRIHVERFNPARRLYERLGFRELRENGIYLLMEWRAGENAASKQDPAA